MDAQASDRARIVVVLTLAVATVGSTLFAMSPLLPDIARSFDVPVSVAGTLPGAYGLALAVVAPIVGLAAQRLPRARVIAAGLAAFGLAWLLAAFTREFAALMALTLLAGAATGAALPATYAYAADLASAGERARVLGRVVSGWSIATLVVVPLMAVAAQAIDWRWAFATLAVCALLLAVVLTKMAGSRAAVAGTPAPIADSGGAADAATAEDGTQDRLLDRPEESLEGRPAGGIVADLRRVAGHARTRRLLAINALDMGAFYAVYSYLGTELRRANDWGATPTGLTLSVYGVGLAILTLNAHWIDRWGPGRSARASLALLAVLVAAIPWLAGSPAAVVVIMVAWGCLQASFFTAVAALAADQLPDLRGVVMSLLSASTFVGIAVYSPIAALLFGVIGYPAVGLLGTAGCLTAIALLREPRLAAQSRTGPA